MSIGDDDVELAVVVGVGDVELACEPKLIGETDRSQLGPSSCERRRTQQREVPVMCQELVEDLGYPVAPRRLGSCHPVGLGDGLLKAAARAGESLADLGQLVEGRRTAACALEDQTADKRHRPLKPQDKPLGFLVYSC